MKVAYITMRFPASSETFACTDIRALRDEGIGVSVHTLRAPRGDPALMLDERGLAGLPVHQGTLRADLIGLASSLRRPALVIDLILWLLKTSWNGATTGRGDGQTSPPRLRRFQQEWVRNSPVVQLLASLLFLPRSMGILTVLEREQPDVVHLFWGHYPCLVGYLVRKALPRTVVSVFLGAHDMTRGYVGSAWLAPRADRVFTHARWNVPLIEALGVPPDRIQVTYRGINRARFGSEPAQKISQRIVCAGRLEPRKGMDDVLLAFRHVRARWPKATLVVVGEGEERAALERLAATLDIGDAVSFLGHVAQQRLAVELAAAQVFLFMSWEDSERLPNVVKEAMASKCVCVVTETSGIEELVADGQHGFVVPRRDVQAAAARIDDVFGGRVDVASILEAGASHVARSFDVTESMRSYRRAWEAALAARARPVDGGANVADRRG